MEFYHYFPSVTFVVLTADQFVGRDDPGPLEQTWLSCFCCLRFVVGDFSSLYVCIGLSSTNNQHFLKNARNQRDTMLCMRRHIL